MNNVTHTVAFLLRSTDLRFVGVMNLGDSAKNATWRMEGGVMRREEIDFPELKPGYRWVSYVNTDRKSVYDDFTEDDPDIEVWQCNRDGGH